MRGTCCRRLAAGCCACMRNCAVVHTLMARVAFGADSMWEFSFHMPGHVFHFCQGRCCSAAVGCVCPLCVCFASFVEDLAASCCCAGVLVFLWMAVVVGDFVHH